MPTETALRRSPVQVAVAVRESLNRINRRLRQTRPLGDLTIAQISAIRSLDAAGTLTPRELSDIERIQPPTMTRIIARLEERGLVHRSPHPTDGRQVILSPSAKSKRLLAEYRRVGDEWLTQRVARLAPAERETLYRAAEILARLVDD